MSAAVAPHYLTTEEAAEYCRYRTTFGLLKAHAKGLVKAYRRGRTYLWVREDLDAFISRSANEGMEEALGATP